MANENRSDLNGGMDTRGTSMTSISSNSHTGSHHPQNQDRTAALERNQHEPLVPLSSSASQRSVMVSSEEESGDSRALRTQQKSQHSQQPQEESADSRNCSSPCWLAMRHVQQQAGFIVNHPTTQWVIIILIALNALMMGVATFDFVKDNENIANAFSIADLVFLVLFTIELALQFLYHGWNLFTDAWLVFDLVIVVTSWLLAEWQIIRALRIFRALRLITRVKVMQNLVVALFSVMPRMFAIWLLLCLVSYIFAVMFTQLFKDLYEQGVTGDTDYFSRLDKTLFTLFQIMTLDAWADIARDVMDVYPWAWLPIIAYVIITGFVVVNLVIAVICDAVAALHDDEKAKLHGQAVPIHDELDEDGNKMDGSSGGGGGGRQGRQRTVVLAPPPTVRDQLTALERHVDELSQQQEATLQTVLAITQQLVQANQRMRQASSRSD